ncbi:MAG: hypothetical protein ACFFD2_24980, partial [Promethearchaeota archaeon]
MIEITPRVITVLIAFPTVIGIFAVLGILILRKDIKYWGNRFYALFFWIVAAGLTFNVSYIFSENLSIIKILNITTIECVNVGIIALLLGNLVIYKGEQYIIGNKKSCLSILAIFIIILSHIYTPEVLTNLEDPRIIWTFPFG